MIWMTWVCRRPGNSMSWLLTVWQSRTFSTVVFLLFWFVLLVILRKSVPSQCSELWQRSGDQAVDCSVFPSTPGGLHVLTPSEKKTWLFLFHSLLNPKSRLKSAVECSSDDTDLAFDWSFHHSSHFFIFLEGVIFVHKTWLNWHPKCWDFRFLGRV